MPRADTHSHRLAKPVYARAHESSHGYGGTRARAHRWKGIIAKRSGGNSVRALMRRPRFDPSEESRNRALSLLRRGWLPRFYLQLQPQLSVDSAHRSTPTRVNRVSTECCSTHNRNPPPPHPCPSPIFLLSLNYFLPPSFAEITPLRFFSFPALRDFSRLSSFYQSRGKL